MPVYAYQRLSMFEQSAGQGSVSALSLSRERQALLDYCVDNGWPAPVWQEERTADWRDGFSKRLLTDDPGEHWRPEPGADVLVYDLARMVNGAQDLLAVLDWFRERDICLHVLNLQAELSQTRTLTRTRVDSDRLLASLADIELRRGADRMRQVKSRQRDKGRFLGGTKPFGYMVHSNGKLIENPLEQRVLKQSRQLRRQGMSLRAIAQRVSTPVAPVSFKTVQRILQREDASAAQSSPPSQKQQQQQQQQQQSHHKPDQGARR